MVCEALKMQKFVKYVNTCVGHINSNDAYINSFCP